LPIDNPNSLGEQLGARTSITHPLQIGTISFGGGGALGLTFCPGKKHLGSTGAWDRDIDTDIATIKTWGANYVISLLEDHEYKELGVEDLPGKMIDEFGRWLSLPICDKGVPDEEWMQSWKYYKSRIIGELVHGRRILIHCKGGFGRTGLVAAMLLMAVGLNSYQAIALCRTVRANAVENRDQENFLHNLNHKVAK
jgi:ADP-ribosyl-[dinitrogen reductase] hydrolase